MSQRYFKKIKISLLAVDEDLHQVFVDEYAKIDTFALRQFGDGERGWVHLGGPADLVVIDANNVIDNATYLDPHQYSSGILYSTVNGVLAVDGGVLTGDGGGRGLRRS